MPPAQRTPLALAILDAAVRAVEKGGEAALRVHDVAARAGCSVALLYRHFGSREGLLEAAMLERMRRFNAVDNRALLDIVIASPDMETFVRRHQAFARDVFGPSREGNRQFIVEFLAASRARPELRKAFVDQQRETQEAFGDVVRAGQSKGLFRTDIDPSAIAAFARGYSFGRILADIDPETTGSFEDWIRCVEAFLSSMGADVPRLSRSPVSGGAARKASRRRVATGAAKSVARGVSRTTSRRAAT